MSGSEAISPTAHYTGQVWVRNGLSHPELSTVEGRLLFEALRPAMTVSRLAGGPILEAYLLARHRAIDALLERAIEHDGVTQVLEVASGMSPRGWRFTKRYGDRITYLEADLPGMAARKRRALEKMGARPVVHDIDALRPGDIERVVASLDPAGGLAIITEGLLGYLPSHDVEALWRRFARVLGAFATGCYLSDLHLGGVQTPIVRAFRVVLSAFVRGRVYLHFTDAEEAKAALLAAGFSSAELLPASAVAGPGIGPGSSLAHILEASTK